MSADMLIDTFIEGFMAENDFLPQLISAVLSNRKITEVAHKKLSEGSWRRLVNTLREFFLVLSEPEGMKWFQREMPRLIQYLKLVVLKWHPKLKGKTYFNGGSAPATQPNIIYKKVG